jgi:hypothetical protein
VAENADAPNAAGVTSAVSSIVIDLPRPSTSGVAHAYHCRHGLKGGWLSPKRLLVIIFIMLARALLLGHHLSCSFVFPKVRDEAT